MTILNLIKKKFFRWEENTMGKGEIADYEGLFGKILKCFMCLQYKQIENTVGKGEIACYEQFLLFPLGFLPV